MSRPKISVVMPVFNDERFLSDAVESVRHQTFSDFEFIIIDDGSTDGSPALLRSFAEQDPRIRMLHQNHRGITVALNAGIRQAQGDLIARMDADDICLPHRFDTQWRFLAEHPQICAVGSALATIDPDGDAIGIMRWPEDHETIVRRLLRGQGGLAHPAAMLRRQAVVDVGGYREHFAVAQDKDLWLRLAEHGQLANLPVVLLKYRQHLRSISSQRKQEQHAAVCRAIQEASARGILERRFISLPAASPVLTPVSIRRTWILQALRSKNIRTALKHIRLEMREQPLSVMGWMNLVRYAWCGFRRLFYARQKGMNHVGNRI